jgi:hypothetical protein
LTPGALPVSVGPMPSKKRSEEDVLLAALFKAGDRLDMGPERERPKAKQARAKKQAKPKKRAKAKKQAKAKKK